MKLLKILFVTKLIVLLLLSSSLASQRMGITKGCYVLLPRRVTTIQAYCMDYTRSAPTESTKYNKVLTDPSNIIVRLQDGGQLSLQQAIDQNKVRIKGNKITFSEMVENLRNPSVWNRLAKEEQEELRPILDMWDNLTKDEVAEMNQLLSEIVNGEGDHTKLAFENLTEQKLEIEFLKNSVLGENGEVIGGLNLDFLNNSSGLTQEEVQMEIWLANNMQHQAILKKLGYYKGELTGIVDEETTEAIKQFQKDKGLNIPTENYGVVDRITENALLEYNQ